MLAIISTVVGLSLTLYCCIRSCKRKHSEPYEVLSPQANLPPRERTNLLTEKKEETSSNGKGPSNYEQFRGDTAEEEKNLGSAVISVFNLEHDGSARLRRSRAFSTQDGCRVATPGVKTVD